MGSGGGSGAGGGFYTKKPSIELISYKKYEEMHKKKSHTRAQTTRLVSFGPIFVVVACPFFVSKT